MESFLESQLANGLEDRSLEHRLNSLKHLSEVLKGGDHAQLVGLAANEELTRVQTRMLARLLLGSIVRPHYLERVWQRGLHGAIAMAATSPICPLFVQVCVVNLDGEQMRTLRVAQVILRTMVPSEGLEPTPDWLVKLIRLQGCVHDVIGGMGDVKLVSRAAKITRWALISRSHLCSTYLDILTSDDKCGINLVALSVVTSVYVSRPEYESMIKPRLMDLYMKNILMAKGSSSVQYKLDSFATLIGSLTENDFSNVMEPVLEKLQKKNPDSILAAVKSVVAQIAIDLSPYAEKIFVPPLLRQLRSPKEDVRHLAVELVGSIARHCSAPEVLEHIVMELLGVLGGKAGVLAQWYQRQCVIMGLIHVRMGVLSLEQGVASIALGAVNALVPAVDKESHEETRSLGLQCMIQWITMLDSIPSEVLDLLKKGTKHSSKPVAAAYLTAVSELSGCISLCTQLIPLVPCLLQRIDGAAGKSSNFHPDGILAAKTLLDIAAQDATVSTEVCTSFPWSLLKDASSFFYPTMMLTSYKPDAISTGEASGPFMSSVCVALCRLLASAGTIFRSQATLFEEGDQGNRLSSVTNAACMALVQCMLLPEKGVRQAALDAVRTIHSCVTEAQRFLLGALKQVVHTVAFAAEMSKKERSTLPSKDNQDSKDSKDNQDSGKALLPPSRLTTALFGCCGTSAVSDVVPLVILLAHDSLVCHSPKGARVLWKHVGRRVFGGVDCVSKLLEDDAVAAEVTSSIVSAANSQVQTQMDSATWAMGSVGSGCGKGGRYLLENHIFPTLLRELRSSEVLSVSAPDIDVFFTAKGVLYGTPSLQKKNTSMVSKNAARRGKDAEEVEWEERIRAELGAKTKSQPRSGLNGASVTGQGNKKPDEMEVAKLLIEEAAVREQVGAVKHQTEAALKVFGAGFSACQELGYEYIPVALPVLLPLLTCRLVETEAYCTVKALVSTANGEFQGVEGKVAAALLLLQVEPARAAGSSTVDACLGVIANTCLPKFSDERPLEPRALVLVFPVLQAVLTNPASAAQCETALRVIAIHSDMDDLWANGSAAAHQAMQELREPMIDAVLSVLDRFPQIEPGPDVVLATLCTGPPLNTSEWGLLLGNRGLLSEAAHVRLACLEAVMMMVLQGQALIGDPLLECRLWLSKFDADGENIALAGQLWEARGGTLTSAYVPPLMVLLSNQKAHVRNAAAGALAAGMIEHPGSAQTVLGRLYDLYTASSPPPRTQVQDKKMDMDKFFAAPLGGEDSTDQQAEMGRSSRSGVAKALEAVGKARALHEEEGAEELQRLFSFLVQQGLSDYDTAIRGQMLAAGMAIITAYGEGSALRFLRPCEAVMEEKPISTEDMQCFDWRREGVVVFMGSAAKHLDKDDPKVISIVHTLTGALSTPSEAVQIAVSDCLAPLVKTSAAKEQAPELLQQLLQRCVKGGTYGERRGAAYGVAAVVKGLGIAAFKKHNVITTLESACKGTSFQGKQGALCAFECMCVRLGQLFEPYVIVILPLLLKCFSDSSNHVREAAHDCARAIMSNLSAHGVKRVLPAILKSLSDPAWRTKQGAIELLGSMAYCAPRQLADCLPMIVPKLTDAFADTHPKVRDSGRKALEDIGSVIRNPEVASLSMILMSALSDPSKHTKEALEALLACEFMHSIDAPSLALLVPVLQRGLKDRSAEVKRKAALITGNTCSMISDAKDLLPYISVIISGLKATCVDPIPDVRATAAKALAALVRGMGEERVSELVPWLVETLKADSSSSERSGGAQGLSEVLVVLGVDRAKSVLEDLLPLAAHPKAPVREGVLWVLCFLPGALMKDFAPIIPQALPVVLAGLSDEVETVREVALRAGQVLVATHGKTHATQLLPALERGLFDDNWRIRQSSIQLLGDLLYLIGDTKEVAVDEDNMEDDSRGSTRAGEAIEEVLGLERRNSVLASLYLIRSDTSAVVRQSALQVWKTVVPNTPKALREILPHLITQIVSALASGHSDNRTVAGRALGDIVKKLGDQVLPEVVPFLRQGLETGDENMRQGVCLGLAEIMECASPRQVEDFIDTLVPAIQDALCDPSSKVREQSAQAFHTLHRAVGIRSIERVVPSLLKQLGKEGDDDRAVKARERAIFGLKEVLQLRPRDLLPYLVPKLVVRPISASHARALGAVAEVTGTFIHYHLSTLLPAVVSELAVLDNQVSQTAPDAALSDLHRLEVLKQSSALLVSYVETVGVNLLCNEMTKMLSTDDPKQRRWAAWLVQQFLAGTQADFEEKVPLLLKELLQRLVDTDRDVLREVWAALKALNARIPAEEMVPHLSFSRTIIASIISDARHRRGSGSSSDYLLPGVNIPRGLEPLLPMYQQGLMYGSREVREAAASGIGELVEVTGPKVLQPFIIKITGPLIRIVGDRFPPGVKAAILHTLGILLSKGGVSLKPFVPQLQTTFVKALSDSNKPVRDHGLTALGQLLRLSTRFDPLIAELVTGANSAGETAVRITLLEALAEVLRQAGAKISTATVSLVVEGLANIQEDSDHDVQIAASRAMGRVKELGQGKKRG